MQPITDKLWDEIRRLDRTDREALLGFIAAGLLEESSGRDILDINSPPLGFTAAAAFYPAKPPGPIAIDPEPEPGEAVRFEHPTGAYVVIARPGETAKQLGKAIRILFPVKR